LAAVGALVEAALLVGPPRVAERGDVHGVRIAGMHDDAADLFGFLEAGELPALPAVRRLVDAGAGGDGIARVRLARAVIHGVRVARRDREHAAGRHMLILEYRTERRAGVRRFPHAAARRRDVEGARGPWNPLHIRDAALVVGGSHIAAAHA